MPRIQLTGGLLLIALGCGGRISDGMGGSSGTMIASSGGSTAESGSLSVSSGGSTAESGSLSSSGGSGAAAGMACTIFASSYDQSCATDSDCVGVREGDVCTARCNCPNAVIRASAQAQYQAAVAGLGPSPVGPACPCAPEPVSCVQGTCVLGFAPPPAVDDGLVEAAAYGGLREAGPDGACTTLTRTLTGVASTSLDYKGNATWGDDRLRAYFDGSTDATGWVAFDLSTLPVQAQVISLHLLLHHQVGYDNPLGGPLVVVDYSDASHWSRASATSNDVPRTAQVSGKTATFSYGSWNDFAVDVGARDWSSDLAKHWLTLGVTNVMPSYSYVYFDGTDDPSVRPQLVIETCE